MAASALLLACILPLCASITSSHLASASTYSISDSRSFIRQTCSKVTYKSLCASSMLPYHDKIKAGQMKQLIHVSLIVTLNYATNSKKLLNGNSYSEQLDSGPVDDCKDQLDSAVDNLSNSVKELHKMGEYSNDVGSVRFSINSMQTWISTSMTSATTCGDGLDSSWPNLLKAISKLNHLCSNTLAIINMYAST